LPDGKGIRDVFQEDQPEDGVLVDGGVEIRAESVRGVPELFVELVEESSFFGAGRGHGRGAANV